MNIEILNQVVEKYLSRHYHNTSIYTPKIADDYKLYAFMCDHIELVYDLMACDVQEDDIDFVYDNSLDDMANTSNLRKYITSLEKENNYEKALIHLAWFFIIEEKTLIKIFKNEPNKLFLDIKGKTCSFFDGMIKAINEDFKEQKEKLKEEN